VLGRTGDAEFIARQRFKMLADCAELAERRARAYAIEAFALVDTARITLVGGNDVARLERIMRVLLQPFGIAPQSAHLDPVPSPGGPLIQVSLGGETVPYWYAAEMDDIVAARVVSVLGPSMRPFVISVSAGVVTVPRAAAISAQLLVQLTSIPGVADGTFFLPDEGEAPDGVTRLMAFAVAPGLGVEEILAGLSPETLELAVEIARIPELVRGFDTVKEEHLEHARAKEAELLAAFRLRVPKG